MILNEILPLLLLVILVNDSHHFCCIRDKQIAIKYKAKVLFSGGFVKHAKDRRKTLCLACWCNLWTSSIPFKSCIDLIFHQSFQNVLTNGLYFLSLNKNVRGSVLIESSKWFVKIISFHQLCIRQVHMNFYANQPHVFVTFKDGLFSRDFLPVDIHPRIITLMEHCCI